MDITTCKGIILDDCIYIIVSNDTADIVCTRNVANCIDSTLGCATHLTSI